MSWPDAPKDKSLFELLPEWKAPVYVPRPTSRAQGSAAATTTSLAVESSVHTTVHEPYTGVRTGTVQEVPAPAQLSAGSEGVPPSLTPPPQRADGVRDGGTIGSRSVGRDGGTEKRRGRKVGKYELTERDLEIVRWLGRYRLATAQLVAYRFGMHRTKAYARLRALKAAGLVRSEPGVRSAAVFLATAQGLAAVDLELAPGRVSAASFAHDLAVAEVAAEAELAGISTLYRARDQAPAAGGT